MHAIKILQRCLSPLLKHMHARRLAKLLEAVGSCVNGPALSLTDVGRRFVGQVLLRNKIKRADRLPGNPLARHRRGHLLCDTPEAAEDPVLAPTLELRGHAAQTQVRNLLGEGATIENPQ